MFIEKSDLLKTLRQVAAFDTNACPYLVVHFPVEGKPEFYRSSGNGFIQTKNFLKQNLAYVSLGHFQDCLKVSPDSLEMSFRQDCVRLNSTESVYDNVLHVHTVKEGTAGVKEHMIGQPNRVQLDPASFAGLDVRPFRFASQPILKNGRLFMSTHAGHVFWNTPENLKPLQLNPRDSFLRFAANGSSLEELMISERGYWGAVRDGVLTFISGHVVGTQLFDGYNIPGVELTKFNAVRLVDSLSRSTVLCGETDRVEVDPKQGVVCRDKYGNEQRFGLGASSGWSKFTMMGRSAKLLVDALSQSTEEEAVLYSIPSKPGMSTSMRLVRGNFEVNFNVQ